MQIIRTIEQLSDVQNGTLRTYLLQKVEEWRKEYMIENMSEVGCFVLLEQSETQKFSMAEMEFTEVLAIGNHLFLHGVKIVTDNFGEDTYLPVEVIAC